jgi:hypothetical protein
MGHVLNVGSWHAVSILIRTRRRHTLEFQSANLLTGTPD